jgi:hypothetical protein
VVQWGERRRIEEDELSIVRRRYPNSASPTKVVDLQFEGTPTRGHPRLGGPGPEGGKQEAAETTLGMKVAPERRALGERVIALEMLALLEATQPSDMPMIGTLADLGVAGALERRTTILAI